MTSGFSAFMRFMVSENGSFSTTGAKLDFFSWEFALGRPNTRLRLAMIVLTGMCRCVVFIVPLFPCKTFLLRRHSNPLLKKAKAADAQNFLPPAKCRIQSGQRSSMLVGHHCSMELRDFAE